MAVAVVAKKLVAREAGDVEIFAAVVVVIAGGHAHAVAGSGEAGTLGNVFKGAVGFLMIDTVPILRASLGRERAFGHGIGDARAVDEEDVETAVVIAVK